MLDKDIILKKISKTEDKLFLSKVLDKVLKASKTKSIVYTDFMDPRQAMLVESSLSGQDEIEYVFSGGYPGAERVIAIFRPDFISDSQANDDPLKLLNVKLKGRESLTHRDYLGALMGLGIIREKIGDILVRDDSCDIVVMREISDYLKYNFVKVGNINIETDVKDIGDISALQPKLKEIKATVASLRLDSVASSGFGVSRSKMADYIKAERVSLNWEVTNNTAKLVKEGDTISIRGKGRVVVENVGGETKKGRICIALKKFI